MSDVGETHTAADLGIAASVTGSEHRASLYSLDEATRIDLLNDGVGIRSYGKIATDATFSST